MTRHPERLGLDVEQRVFDSTEPLGDHTARGWPGKRVEFRIDPLVVEGILADDPSRQPLDYRADPRGSEPFVELAPTDDAVIGAELEEMIVPPARVTAKDFETCHFHRRSPVARRVRQNQVFPAGSLPERQPTVRARS